MVSGKIAFACTLRTSCAHPELIYFYHKICKNKQCHNQNQSHCMVHLNQATLLVIKKAIINDTYVAAKSNVFT